MHSSWHPPAAWSPQPQVAHGGSLLQRPCTHDPVPQSACALHCTQAPRVVSHMVKPAAVQSASRAQVPHNPALLHAWPSAHCAAVVHLPAHFLSTQLGFSAVAQCVLAVHSQHLSKSQTFRPPRVHCADVVQGGTHVSVLASQKFGTGQCESSPHAWHAPRTQYGRAWSPHSALVVHVAAEVPLVAATHALPKQVGRAGSVHSESSLHSTQMLKWQLV